MCLKDRNSDQYTQNILPKQPFYAYKWLALRGTRLVSPSYTHKQWHPGEMLASGQNQNNGDSGMYLFLCEPGKTLVRTQGEVIVRLTVDPKDVVASGQDSWGGTSGTCVVARRAQISQQDYDDAVAGKTVQVTTEELKVAQETVSEAKKTAKTAKEEIAKKEAAEQETAKTAVKKAKKTVKKATKTGKKPVKKTDKATAKANKTVKSAKKAVKKTVKAGKKSKPAKLAAAIKKLAKTPRKKPQSGK